MSDFKACIYSIHVHTYVCVHVCICQRGVGLDDLSRVVVSSLIQLYYASQSHPELMEATVVVKPPPLSP